MDSLLAFPAPKDFLSFPDSFGKRFMLVIDTEEEFDWDAPFDRNSRSVTVTAGMERAQTRFKAAGLRPLYATDYPVIDDPRAGEMLAQWVTEGSADVGAHCHPWVNPPHIEDVCLSNSFVGNLPEELERAKITALRDRITQVVGKAPLAYRAGRYGIGPNSGRILRDLGFLIDTSTRSLFDYSSEHGPDFTHSPLRPYRTGPDKGIVELPLSTVFTGSLRKLGRRFIPALERRGTFAGILAKSGMLQRIPLSPEGVSIAEAKIAIDHLLQDGLRLLMFSFHSPTLAPGHTPYVHNEADLDAFYEWWDEVFYHLANRGVTAASLDDIITATR